MNKLNKEIGSEFHSSCEFDKNIKKEVNIDLNDFSDYTFLRSGREAIGFILDQIKPAKKLAILPTYICESMLTPFLKRGYKVDFFSVDKQFNPNIGELEVLLSKEPDILLVIDWFGMNKNQRVVSTTRSFSQNTKVLADCTHSFFNGRNNFNPDYIVVSLRKWFALPDGALAASYSSSFISKARYKENGFVSNRKYAMKLKSEYLISKTADSKRIFRELLYKAEKELENNTEVLGISKESLLIINRLDFNDMKNKRRENYNTLYQLIKNLPVVLIINRYMQENETPLFFSILAEGYRDDLQKWLANKNIYCPILWPLPRTIYKKHKISAYISDNILSIPCDQRYTLEDMNYIYNMLKTYFEENYDG